MHEAPITTVPGDASVDTSTIGYKFNGKECRMSSVKVSDDYFKTLSISLLKGRLFNGSFSDENTRTAIINESAVLLFLRSKIDPEFPIRYSFLDDNFKKLFSTYRQMQIIINFFAFTAIFISVIGLFAAQVTLGGYT